MKKHLYEENGTGTMGDNEISIKVKKFVDDMYNSFGDYIDADLELYIIEDIMTEFCHKRIKRRLEVIKERKNNDDNR
jgi:hypothetical protein